MKAGFDCLDSIDIQKKIIMGNHDIEDGINQGCSILKYQLKLPWYDVKFPFSHELHYIKDDDDDYKILLILYIDTTLYTGENIICYNSTLNKSRDMVKCEQNAFIHKTLDDLKDNNKISDILICGHEPLITYKFKKNKEKSSIITELCQVIFNRRNIQKYESKNFTYLCADYHIYQHSTIKCNDKLSITQIILGTGGGELDEIVPSDKNNNKQFEKYFDNCTYSLQIEKNICTNQNESFGIAKHGYGELIYNKHGLTHTFIPVEPVVDSDKSDGDSVVDSDKSDVDSDKSDVESVGGDSDLFKIKYLKYKNKYLKLKKMTF